MNRYSDEEIEEYLEPCKGTRFCDFCEEPEGKIWCLLTSENEVDYAVGECCIDKQMDEILEEIEYWRSPI